MRQTMKPMQHILKIFLIGAALCLTLMGQSFAQKKVIIGNFGVPAPYEAAIADGSFEKATGWTIEWRKFNSGAEVNSAMASGAVMMSVLGSVPLAAGASQGLDYQMFLIANAIGETEALIARNGSGITQPSDLKGKKIAVPVGSTAHFSLLGALKNWGITDKEVQVLGMSPAEINAAWNQNAIDATFIWEPVLSQVRKNGTLMTTAAEVGKAGYVTFNGWVVNPKFAEENREALIAFIKVMNNINASYNKNKAQWGVDSAFIKAIAARYGTTPKEIIASIEGATYPDGEEQISAEWLNGGVAQSMKLTADFLKSAGRINASEQSYVRFVNMDMAKRAVAPK